MGKPASSGDLTKSMLWMNDERQCQKEKRIVAITVHLQVNLKSLCIS